MFFYDRCNAFIPLQWFGFIADNYIPFDDGNVNFHIFYVLCVPWTTFFMNSSNIDVVQRHVPRNEHNYIETFEITRMEIEWEGCPGCLRLSSLKNTFVNKLSIQI